MALWFKETPRRGKEGSLWTLPGDCRFALRGVQVGNGHLLSSLWLLSCHPDHGAAHPAGEPRGSSLSKRAWAMHAPARAQ